MGLWPCIGRARIVARIIAAVSPPAGAAAGAALVRAPLGGGKTRVIDEVVAGLAAKGRATRRIVATSATSSVPFGAVAHLLPPGARDSADPLALIAALRDVLAPEGQKRTVLIVDDAPLLDVATSGVIATLAGAGAVDLVASGRTEEPLPDPFVDVLLGDRAYAVDLDAMSDEDIDTLLHLALGGPVDGAVMLSLRDRSAGNPLFLRELTRSALEAGALVEVSGVWRLRGDLPGSSRLREVVESRLDIVAPLTRPALELLAICDTVDLDELESLVGLEALAELESRGLLRLVPREGRQLATLGHPLHGEAIRLSLPTVRSRLLLRGHVQWLEQHTSASKRDPLEFAILRLDAGLPADMDSLLQGARLAAALQDFKSTLRLARPLFDQDPTAETGWLVADALFQTGEWTDAFGVLDKAATLPAPADLRVDLAVARAMILLWGVGSTDMALAVLAELRSDPAMGPDNLERLTAEYASVLVNHGQPGEARNELAAAAHSDRLQTRLGAAVSYTTALAVAGQTTEALETIDRALRERPDDLVTGVAASDTYLVAKAMALIERGRLEEAYALAEDGYEQAVSGARPLMQFWFTLIMGRASLCRGMATTALRHFTSARALGLDAGLAGPTRSALVGVAVASSMLQDTSAAEAAMAAHDALPPFGFMGPEATLAHGWVAKSKGDLAQSRSILMVGADDAVATGHITSAIWILHHVARLGKPEEVVERISSLAAGTDSPFAQARARHTQALVSGSARDLVAATTAFEDMGANFLAAEAAAGAADAFRREGDQRQAASLAIRAERLVGLCENAISATLLSAPGGVEPLTDREREIAFLAANGQTSRQIADQLYLSYRTVNNHLQHVYDKLGARGRSELRRALGMAPE